MLLSVLPAFRYVTQLGKPRLSGPDRAARIEDMYCSVLGSDPSIKGMRDRVKVLWQLEAQGVAWGRYGGDRGGRVYPSEAEPILIVGMGAGLIARLGFSPLRDLKRCIDEAGPMAGYAWEGVGHMVELANHPLVASALGMPRKTVPLRFLNMLRDIERDRVNFGRERMAYLCSGADPWTLGAQFVQGILALYHNKPVSPTHVAYQFIKKIWPEVEA